MRCALVALCIVAACGGPPRPVVRTVVTSSQSFGGISAVGTVTLIDAGDVGASRHRVLAVARAWWQIGTVLVKEGRAPDGYEAARRGLAALGTTYRTRTLKDDTTTELLRADDLAEVPARLAALAAIADLEHAGSIARAQPERPCEGCPLAPTCTLARPSADKLEAAGKLGA